MTIVQRSPDLGINIRLQPLSEAPKVLASKPLPPYWWGWKDANKNPAVDLVAEWNEAAVPQSYGDSIWCAVVENTPTAYWEVEYVPKIWFNGEYSDFEEIVAWTGAPVKWTVPPSPIPASSTLFAQKTVPLPDPLKVKTSTVPLDYYWLGPVMGIPLVIATGNTLSVLAYPGSPSGVLTATAFVAGKRIGIVHLTIKRVTTYTPA